MRRRSARGPIARMALGCVVLAMAGCDSSSLLGPDAAQGVEGVVMIGPLCPVSTPDDPCPDRPHQATLRVLDQSQKTVTEVRSGSDGTFRVGLKPGLYILSPEQGDPLPTAKELAVRVEEGVWSTVIVRYDTGIR